MKLTHRQKVKLARRMRTRKELIAKVPIFQTRAWGERAKARAK